MMDGRGRRGYVRFLARRLEAKDTKGISEELEPRLNIKSREWRLWQTKLTITPEEITVFSLTKNKPEWFLCQTRLKG